MSSENLPAVGDQSFESLRQTNSHGAEFWSARHLQPLLGYSQWRRFEGAIQTRRQELSDQQASEIEQRKIPAARSTDLAKMPMIGWRTQPASAIFWTSHPSHRSLLRKVTCIKDGFFYAPCQPAFSEVVA